MAASRVDVQVNRELRGGRRFLLASALVLAPILLLLIGGGLIFADLKIRAMAEARLATARNLVLTLVPAVTRLPEAERQAALGRIQLAGQFNYLVLADGQGRSLPGQNWPPEQALPPAMTSLSDVSFALDRFDGRVELGGVQAAYGVSLADYHLLSRQLWWQGALLGALAFGGILLGLFLMRLRLSLGLIQLLDGMARWASGEKLDKLAVPQGRIAGRLVRAFNDTLAAVSERLEALAKREARFRIISDSTWGLEAWFNRQGRLIWINASVERITGYSVQECMAARDLVELLVYDKDRAHTRAQALKAYHGEQSHTYELRLARKDGALVWVAMNWRALRDEHHRLTGLRVSVDDIQDRKQAELRLLETVAELRREQALKTLYLNRSDEALRRLRSLLDVMATGVLFCDVNGRVLLCNRAMLALMGLPPEENVSGVRVEVLAQNCRDRVLEPQVCEQKVQEAATGANVGPWDIRLRDGRILSGLVTTVEGRRSGSCLGRVWLFEDVTAQRANAERLAAQAHHDALTNLYNRRRFDEELGRMVSESRRRGVPLGLLIIDLDGFKPVNDQFGHLAGDEVLVTLARRVGAIVRRSELFFRLGGDEFAVLVMDGCAKHMAGLARRVGQCICELEWHFDGQLVTLSASLGIAIYPDHADNAEQLIARADHAMYQSKSAGRNTWRIYQPDPASPWAAPAELEQSHD